MKANKEVVIQTDIPSGDCADLLVSYLECAFPDYKGFLAGEIPTATGSHSNIFDVVLACICNRTLEEMYDLRMKEYYLLVEKMRLVSGAFVAGWIARNLESK